ncbi:MAG TPA: hypothetical protein VGS21_12170, partial [Acidimicrobiales bacterium]|nr:hypothetical protein [Acidimicrobiales bacterium]
ESERRIVADVSAGWAVPGGDERSVTVVVGSGLASYRDAAERAGLAWAAGREVIGIAPSRASARNLEAMTGVECVTRDDLGWLTVRPGSLVMVPTAARLDPRSLATVVGMCRSSGAGLVLMAPDPSRWADAVALEGIAHSVGVASARTHPARNLAAMDTHEIHGVVVHVAASPDQALIGAVARAAELGAEGSRVALVVPDRSLHSEAGARTFLPRGAEALVAAGTLDSLVVVGDAGSLPGRLRGAASGVGREHFAVVPSTLAAAERRGRAAEIALPAEAISRLGVRLRDPEGRAAWRNAFSALDSPGDGLPVEALRDLSSLRRQRGLKSRGRELARGGEGLTR